VASADNADTGNPFRRPAYIILNQAIGGDSGGDPSNSTFPIRFEVDWVRVYQRAEP
jgi:beta-glucanase (GH16 family)